MEKNFLLILCMMTFFVVPWVYSFVEKRPQLFRWLEIGVGLYLFYALAFHILPETFTLAQGKILPMTLAFLAGLIIFSLIEHSFIKKKHHENEKHLLPGRCGSSLFLQRAGMGLCFLGVFLHTLMDGMALFGSAPTFPSAFHAHLYSINSLAHAHSTQGSSFPGMAGLGNSFHALGISVFLHNIPFAFFMWGGLKKFLSLKLSYALMIFAALTIFFGHKMAGQELVQQFLLKDMVFFQAFIGGALLHILLDPLFHQMKKVKN